MIIIQPGDDPQSLGQVKNDLTGEVFTINSDISKESEKDNKGCYQGYRTCCAGHGFNSSYITVNVET